MKKIYLVLLLICISALFVQEIIKIELPQASPEYKIEISEW